MTAWSIERNADFSVATLKFVFLCAMLRRDCDIRNFALTATPAFDGGEPGTQAWWETPCVDRI